VPFLESSLADDTTLFILKLTIPAILTTISSAFIKLVDGYIVPRLGTNAPAVVFKIMRQPGEIIDLEAIYLRIVF
jgi:hypothetical protein